MADLSNILGGPWSPTTKHIDPPDVQLLDAIRAAGLEPPDHIQMDGKIHRFRSGTKGSPGLSDKPGWYLVFGDGIPAGRFGCWRAGIEVTWRADVGRQLTQPEEMAHARRIAEAQKLRDAELKRQRETASETVEIIWVNGGTADPEHPYLKRKGIQTHGARTTGDGRLMVPLYDADGSISSLQYIDKDGGKLYHPGGQTGGKFWMLGTMDEPGTLYVAEGFATAATIHETTNRPVVIAYSASNLVPVTGTLREMYGAVQELVIVADNDKSGVGQRYAEQACAKYGARMVMPPEPGDANDYAQAGNDLAGLLAPAADDWLVRADEFSAQPAPISWLVKRWIQDNALVMVHGPSGGGKTFVVLDWCLRIASAIPEWCGNKVRPGNVVYLAGEGHHGLRGRIAAWKHQHKPTSINMWLSKHGCDLNTPAGYHKVAEHIRMLPETPKVIVVDTLHRFLAGDENSAQDAKTMLDACGNLMQEFACSVILVHHTGVSEEAQHRARGSSAWRGALDIEISVIPAGPNNPMQLVQRKSKDAEIAKTVFLDLQQVTIPGWYDEDNQAVTSAVVIESQAPAAPTKKDSKIEGFRKVWENAWWASGAEDLGGAPYLTRSALKDKLAQDGNAERTIRNMINPSYTDKLIGAMLQAGMIETTEHGWIVIDEAQAGAMMMRKNGV